MPIIFKYSPELYFQIALALISAAVVCFAATPIVRAFANKVGAIDVPKDETRVHDHPIPRLGGLAIFLGFLFSVLLFADVSRQVQGLLLGAVVIVISGVIDDIVSLKWYVKLAAQVFAALIAVRHGIVIEVLSNPNIFSQSQYIFFGWASIPVTVMWIIVITNSVNLIDGLDGLACGVSAISSVTMLIISLLVSELNVAVMMAALCGACIGFLPFNLNPAKIFMGDTGALLLGYALATVSILGLFKFYAIVSFAVPFLVIGLPLFDTGMAIIRRVLRGQHPMHRDRGHFHHRLIDMGLSQKQAVAILYSVSAILGLAAVVITTSGEMRAIILVIAIAIAAVIAGFLWRSLRGAKVGAARVGAAVSSVVDDEADDCGEAVAPQEDLPEADATQSDDDAALPEDNDEL
ncbi:MAG: undecaprenyl/decaprenyl-phosphate alpha-N-acetylglucosaminyl 1-phosphate transferase [Oscillospiraceae bacterium]|jgi:UDP-GlcNAc:undecaprenyl-phosphate GlcNAc-1-phosphate transferase|nr:undecaprenyl/decaprenyl-phosphate alpha-N-acetylglucosaminyl 1-phosphate transferase [Oscillospiraceae bacterium]